MTREPRTAAAPVLALVESNTTGTGRLFAAAARSRGLRPVLLSVRPDRYPWVTDDAVEVAWADTADPDAVARVSARLARPGGLAGIVTSSEYFVGVAARAAARAGLPGPKAPAMEACRDKRHQRTTLAAAGVPIPRFETVSSVSAALGAAADIGFPVVCKPADGTGSRGVRLCPDRSTVAAHARALLARRHDERGRPALPWLMVEEHMDGPEFSVETFGPQVVGVTAKRLGPLPSFVETGHDFPALPGDGATADLAGTAERAVGALGVGWGAAHTEVRIGRAGPVVIEVNPRLAGGQIPVLVLLATGVDLIGATIDLATGSPVGLPDPGRGSASIRFLVAHTEGELGGVDGLGAAAAVPGVVAVTVTTPSGTLIGGTGSFLDRVGYVITAGPDAAATRAAADAALACLSLRPACPSLRGALPGLHRVGPVTV